MTWEELFERAPEGVTIEDVRAALARRRDPESQRGSEPGSES